MAGRRLILNVDDIGIHEGAVEDSIATITDGVAASGSVMAVCAGSRSALEMLADRPDVPVGVHLTLTRDFSHWAWAPLTRGATIQKHGLLLEIGERDRLLTQAIAAEVEAEFRAQIEFVIGVGVRPTHLDWHCLADGGRADIFDVTLELADEYGVGIRAWTDHGRQSAGERGRVVQDQPLADSFAMPTEGKQQHVIDLIRALPHGLSEWAMHPARPVAGDTGSDVRSSDYDTLMSRATRDVLVDEGITVIGYGDPTAWRGPAT